MIPLTQAVLMNIDCNAQSEEFYKQPDIEQGYMNLSQSSQRIIPHKGMQAYFECNGIINTGKLHAQIIRDRHGPKLRKYIMEKFDWDQQQLDQINWAVVQTSFNRKTF